jgi:hypothetical protein
MIELQQGRRRVSLRHPRGAEARCLDRGIVPQLEVLPWVR